MYLSAHPGAMIVLFLMPIWVVKSTKICIVISLNVACAYLMHKLNYCLTVFVWKTDSCFLLTG